MILLLHKTPIFLPLPQMHLWFNIYQLLLESKALPVLKKLLSAMVGLSSVNPSRK